MAAPTGKYSKYHFGLLNNLSDFHAIFTDDFRKWRSCSANEVN